MKVYVVEVCGCKERGTLEFAAVFDSEEKADSGHRLRAGRTASLETVSWESGASTITRCGK